jgi:hypothetical protein
VERRVFKVIGVCCASLDNPVLIYCYSHCSVNGTTLTQLSLGTLESLPHDGTMLKPSVLSTTSSGPGSSRAGFLSTVHLVAVPLYHFYDDKDEVSTHSASAPFGFVVVEATKPLMSDEMQFLLSIAQLVVNSLRADVIRYARTRWKQNRRSNVSCCADRGRKNYMIDFSWYPRICALMLIKQDCCTSLAACIL